MRYPDVRAHPEEYMTTSTLNARSHVIDGLTPQLAAAVDGDPATTVGQR